MAQYHPDKARKMHEKLALKLEAGLNSMESAPGHLAYNLGNLWYHAGDLGRGNVLWYRRAELELPGNKHVYHTIFRSLSLNV